LNHPNYQQNAVNNVQYKVHDDSPMTDPNNSTNGIWAVDPNPAFGQPLAIVPKFGARSFQFSTRFSF
jgi:hypothetical protein